ncbi:hypothetical protein ACFQMA_05820 [Halosimplex aquaticum]|uniref:Uncharacterized protein n=1 Tax=Halosimplex aquaticum TaxID=3026162 RepID=A0ABD5Y0W8_9EURY|nr:hypothetical protein [Halosimplex aquaticum]
MDVEEAILVELFAILLVLFAGVNELTDTWLLAEWDVIGNMTIWMALGLLIGLYGVIAGIRSEDT